MYMPRKIKPIPSSLYFEQFKKKQHKQIIMKKNAQTRKRAWQTFFSAPTSQILKLEGLKWPPHLTDYEDMLSLQWVNVVQKICPTDGLRVSWPAQLVRTGWNIRAIPRYGCSRNSLSSSHTWGTQYLTQKNDFEGIRSNDLTKLLCLSPKILCTRQIASRTGSSSHTWGAQLARDVLAREVRPLSWDDSSHGLGYKTRIMQKIRGAYFPTILG